LCTGSHHQLSSSSPPWARWSLFYEVATWWQSKFTGPLPMVEDGQVTQNRRVHPIFKEGK
jgi:hypothetical protein